MFDQVTDLPNKILFRYSLKNAISRVRRTQQKLILMLVVIVNNNEEHKETKRHIDNKTIKEFANLLKERVRESDIVAHLVNGKFAILLEGISDSSAGTIVYNKIMNDINSIGQFSQNLSVHIGYSVFPEDGDDVDILWQSASATLFDTTLTI